MKEHAHWEPESMDEQGNVLMKLTGVDVPLKYNTGNVEKCFECGTPTIAGIYDLKTPGFGFLKNRPANGRISYDDLEDLDRDAEL